MSGNIRVLIGRLLCLALPLLPAPAAGQRSSDSAKAAEEIRRGRGLSTEEVSRLEESLKTNPEDLFARARLLGYYFHSLARSDAPRAVRERRGQILWLIEHHPESALAGAPEASIDPSGHLLADAEGYEKAKALWITQSARRDVTAAVLLHAATFFELRDKERAEELLKPAMKLEPENREIVGRLANLYALGILGVEQQSHTGIPFPSTDSKDEAFAAKARSELGSSSNASLVGAAGYVLSLKGSMIEAMTRTDSGISEFARRLLEKAAGLDPSSPEWPHGLASFYASRGMRATTPEAKQTFARKRLEALKRASELSNPDARFDVSIEIPRAALEAGERETAKKTAEDLLLQARDHIQQWSYGSALHYGNIVLGRIALADGDCETAKRRLLDAGRTPGGGTLTSFGPNMSLAKELLGAGEKDSVMAYLELCKRFWTSDRGLLDKWIQTIRSGGQPEFGGNLIY